MKQEDHKIQFSQLSSELFPYSKITYHQKIEPLTQHSAHKNKKEDKIGFFFIGACASLVGAAISLFF